MADYGRYDINMTIGLFLQRQAVKPCNRNFAYSAHPLIFRDAIDGYRNRFHSCAEGHCSVATGMVLSSIILRWSIRGPRTIQSAGSELERSRRAAFEPQLAPFCGRIA